MKWMETIKITIAQNRRAILEEQLAEIMANLNAERKGKVIKFYQNLQDGDMCIHLNWSHGKAEPRGSRTGLCLAHLLKDFGLTSHSVWIEKD